MLRRGSIIGKSGFQRQFNKFLNNNYVFKLIKFQINYFNELIDSINILFKIIINNN